MKYIDFIIDIPEFIKQYINKKDLYCWLENSTHDMCRALLDLQYRRQTNDGMDELVTDILFDKNVKRFLDFYFTKIRIDRKGFCPYEDELDLPESIMNEVFKVKADGVEKLIFIDSYEDSRLTLIEIK